MTELKSEGFLREQLDKSLKESKQLRAKIEVIDKVLCWASPTLTLSLIGELAAQKIPV